MDIRSQTTLRTKKLGVLIRDVRLAARRSLDECAKAVGVTKGVFRAYEEGRRAPSLPELEILVYYLKLPIDHFWGKASISEEQLVTDPLDLPQLMELRQRMIGALLRQQRNNASISIKSLTLDTGIPSSRIKAYELGDFAQVDAAAQLIGLSPDELSSGYLQCLSWVETVFSPD